MQGFGPTLYTVFGNPVCFINKCSQQLQTNDLPVLYSYSNNFKTVNVQQAKRNDGKDGATNRVPETKYNAGILVVQIRCKIILS